MKTKPTYYATAFALVALYGAFLCSFFVLPASLFLLAVSLLAVYLYRHNAEVYWPFFEFTIVNALGVTLFVAADMMPEISSPLAIFLSFTIATLHLLC